MITGLRLSPLPMILGSRMLPTVNCTIVSATAVMTDDRSVPNWMSASAVGKIGSLSAGLASVRRTP
jgi:hypothetical protein